jgi:type III secretory pathway component EscV
VSVSTLYVMSTLSPGPRRNRAGRVTFRYLLLLTTLLRLSLNIASTKLILLNDAAHHIIYTFGRMVVGVKVVVGLVVPQADRYRPGHPASR